MPQNDHSTDPPNTPPPRKVRMNPLEQFPNALITVGDAPGQIPACVRDECDRHGILCECHHCPNCQHGDRAYEVVGSGSVRGALECLVDGCGCTNYMPLTVAYLPQAPDNLIDLIEENLRGGGDVR